MDEYELLAEAIRRVFPASRFDPATEERINRIRHEHPDVPNHYLEFLQRIGWGSLGDSNFMIYSGPITPEFMFGDEFGVEMEDVLIVGEDFSGWAVGFDTGIGWRLVGVDSGYPIPEPLKEKSLSEFIARRVANHESAV